MSQLERFLNGTPGNGASRRDRKALERQVSADNAAAVRKRNQEHRRHLESLARQAEITERAEHTTALTRRMIDRGRAEADGDPLAGELILETIKLAHRKLNDKI